MGSRQSIPSIPSIPCSANNGHQQNTRKAILGAQDPKGNTFLMKAVEKGHYEMVKMLIAAGVDIHVKNNLEENALSVAIKSNCPDPESKWAIIKLLYQKGARLQKTAVHLKYASNKSSFKSTLDGEWSVECFEDQKAETLKSLLEYRMYSMEEISNEKVFKGLSIEYQADIEDYARKEGILNQNAVEGGQKPWYGIFLPFMQLNAGNTDPYGVNNIRKSSTDSAEEDEGQKQEDQEPLLVELNQADHTPLPDVDADRPSPRSFGL